MLKNMKRVQVNVGLNESLVDLLDRCFPMSSRSSAVRHILIDYFRRYGLIKVEDNFERNFKDFYV